MKIFLQRDVDEEPNVECGHQDESFRLIPMSANWDNSSSYSLTQLFGLGANKPMRLGIIMSTSGITPAKRSFKEVKLLLLIVIDSQ